MAKRKGQHKSDKEQYAAYKAKSQRDVNRKKRLERHMRKHPNDAQTAAVVGKVKAFKVKSHTKGHFPKPKDEVIVNKAGHKLPMGNYSPQRSK